MKEIRAAFKAASSALLMPVIGATGCLSWLLTVEQHCYKMSDDVLLAIEKEFGKI